MSTTKDEKRAILAGTIVLVIGLFIIGGFIYTMFNWWSNKDYDKNTLLVENDSLVNCYLEKISLKLTPKDDEQVDTGKFPSDDYVIFYDSTSIKYFVSNKTTDKPILGRHGGSFGDHMRFDDMISMNKKLKNGEMDFVFLVHLKKMNIYNIHYDKKKITRQTPFGQNLDEQKVDVDVDGTKSDACIVCYLIDFKKKRAISYQEITIFKEDKNNEAGSIIENFTGLTTSQRDYIDHELRYYFNPL